MQRAWLLLTLLLVVTLNLSAQETDEPETLTLVTHDFFNVSEDVLRAFEDEHNLRVAILRQGDAGQMINQVILSRNNPLGDLVFGVDNTFLSRALNAEVFQPYTSPALEDVPERFILDDEHRVTPIDFGDVCLNADIGYFEANALALPQSLAELTDPAYEGLLVVQNPATSSPGLAFMLATIAQFGTDAGDEAYNWLDYWRDLVANDVLVVDDWGTAYYTEFSAPGREGGDRPLVVSYASSPPVEVAFSEDDDPQAVTTAITAPGTCFRQIEFAGILAGADNVDGAQAFIDFLLSQRFQEDMPLQMFVYPVNDEAELPEVFTEFSSIPDEPATLPYEEIDANREAWLDAWTQTVLR